MPTEFLRKKARHQLEVSRILPLVFNRRAARPLYTFTRHNPRRPIVEPLIDDLLVAYALDLPDSYQIVTEPDLAQLQLTEAQLYSVAVENLKRRVSGIRQEWDRGVMEISIGNQLSASVLLLPDYWDTLATAAAGEVLVAIPEDGTLLVTSFNQTEGGLAALQARIEETSGGEGEDEMTRNVLVWRSRHWEVIGPARPVQIAV